MLSYLENKNIQQQYTKLLENDEQIRYLLKSIQFRITGTSNDQRAYLLTGSTEYNESIKEKQKLIENDLSEIKSKKLNTELHDSLVKLEKEIQVLMEIGEKVRSTYKDDPKVALQLHLTEEREMRKKKLDPALTQLIELIDEKKANNMASIEHNNQLMNVWILISLLTAMIIGLVILFLLQKSLKPLTQLQISLQTVANGDLTKNIPVKTKDEVGELTISLNKMIDTLRTTISTIYNSSLHLAASSDELSASSEQSTKATEQLSHLTQKSDVATEQQLVKFSMMAEIINKLLTEIQQGHANGGVIGNLSETAKVTADQGHQDMATIVSEMSMIASSVEETSKIIHGLEEKSAAIENIVSLISNLAEQTNLLALNAAIESARAGEHGKGFAVVADEVRKLAEESKNAANNVREVLAEIQRETEIGVHSMQNSLNKIQSGISSTRKVNGTFNVIETTISQLSKQVEVATQYLQNMNNLSERVVVFVKEVNSLAEMNTTVTHETLATTQQQLATSEEISSAADKLAKLADEQKLLITKFNI